MKKFVVEFAENCVIEKLYELKRARRAGNINIDNYCNDIDDDEILPVNKNDEERLIKGFRILDMAKNGYPADS